MSGSSVFSATGVAAVAVCAGAGCLVCAGRGRRSSRSSRSDGGTDGLPDAQAAGTQMPTSGHSAAAKDDGGAQPVPVPSATATADTAAPPAEKPPATGGAEPQVDMLGLAQSPVEAQLLKKIDALYAELKLEEVKDVLDDALRDESDLATIVQLLQFRASVLFGLGNVQESMDEYSHCTQLVQQAEAVPDDTAEQVNQFWAIKAALNLELGNKDEAEDCLEEAESNGMLRAEAESLGNEIVNGYKEDAVHFQTKLKTGSVPEEFSIKVKATTAVQQVSEMEAQDHLEAAERAQATVEETGVEVQVQVPDGAMPGQQVPCQTAAGMPAHMITIPMDAKAGDTINVKLPRLEDLAEERLQEFVKILTDSIDSGSKHPQLIAGCLAKRAMHYLLLGRLDDSLSDLGNLLAITEHKPVSVDPTAAEAFIMSGFVHRLSVMGCVQQVPPSPEAIRHEKKATASFQAAQNLGVENLQESIGMMESEIQRAPRVRSIIEAFAKNQQMQQMLAKQQVQAGGGTGAKASGKGGKSAETTKEAKEVKKAIKQGSEAFDKKEYYEAIQAFTKALDMNPSLKWRKWLYKNRAVCYKYTKQWEEMAGDAQQSCTLEPTVPENFLRRAVALKQLKDRDEELQAVCTQAEALDMPDKLRDQLQMLMR